MFTLVFCVNFSSKFLENLGVETSVEKHKRACVWVDRSQHFKESPLATEDIEITEKEQGKFSMTYDQVQVFRRVHLMKFGG